jgi:DNA-binding CsgD family transcriptional regulator
MTDKGARIVASLTKREREVLVAAISSGDPLIEVGKRLSLTAQGMKNTMRSIYAKFGIHNRHALLLFSVAHGVVNCPCGKP